MLGFRRKKKRRDDNGHGTEGAELPPGAEGNDETAPSAAEPAPREGRRGWLRRLRSGLRRTGSGLATVFLGRKTIDDDLLEELETLLLMADVGVEATQRIIDDLTERLKRKELADTDALHRALR
ncbi:MAG: signal recognition particle receptor subunit alpha, partial [Ectothiorhodospiraceae bacterium]